MKKIALATLIATVVVAFVPILWDLWSNGYSATFYIEKHYVLIENNSGVDDLKVTLANREIRKLVATEVSLENSGRHSIAKEDVLQPVTVTVLGAPILGIKPRDIYPRNMIYEVQQRSATSFSVVFDVLNRNEHISLTVLTDGEPSAITAAARMKNISMLALTDLDRHPSFIKRIWLSTYVLAVVAILTFAQLVVISRAWQRRRRELRDLGLILKVGFDKTTLEKYLAPTILPYFGRRYKREARDLISSTDPQDEQQVNKLLHEITTLGAITHPDDGWLKYVVVIVFGILYVLVTLVIAALQT